jgi:2-O-methyltransferase
MKPNIMMERGAIEIRALKQLVGKIDPVIVEVGANVGQTTEQFLREMPMARIYCFEPDPRAIAKFKDRIRSPNVKLFECAVGKDNGFVSFNQSSGEGVAKDWDQSGSIRRPKLHSKTWPWVKFETKIEVPITRLDDWARIENISSVDLVWADTHGAESDLIEGGLSVLRNTRFLYTEYGAEEWYEGQISLDAMCDALEAVDLRLIRLFSMDALFSNQQLNTSIFDSEQGTIQSRRNALCPCGSGQKFKDCHGKSS